MFALGVYLSKILLNLQNFFLHQYLLLYFLILLTLLLLRIHHLFLVSSFCILINCRNFSLFISFFLSEIIFSIKFLSLISSLLIKFSKVSIRSLMFPYYYSFFLFFFFQILHLIDVSFLIKFVLQ